MMNSWVKEVKFMFGNADGEYNYVAVPGVTDNEEADVEDDIHTMQRYDLLYLNHSKLYITDHRIKIQ
jgi:hypothetical protein